MPKAGGHCNSPTQNMEWRKLHDGDAISALTHFRRSLEMAQDMAAKDTDNAQARRDVALYYGKTGQALLALGKPRQALASFQKPLAVFEKLAQSQPGNRDLKHMLVITHCQIGKALLRAGDAKQALEAFARSARIGSSLLVTEPGDTGTQGLLMLSAGEAGDALLRLGRVEDALDSYQKSLELGTLVAGQDPMNAGFRIHRALARCRIGRAQTAMARQARQLADKQSLMREAHRALQQGSDELAELRRRHTWYRENDEDLERAQRDLAEVANALTLLTIRPATTLN
jgi:tetratricopeptide (TPR) repeat protein